MGTDRRRLLAVTGATVLGGCAGGDDRPPGLFNVGLTNMTDSPVSVDVTVWKDGEAMFDGTVELSGNPAKGVRNLTRPWMLDRVPYEVEFTAAWNDEQVTKKSTSGPEGANCYGVNAVVWPERLAVKEHDTNECEREPNRD